jgi:hypothetical protein
MDWTLRKVYLLSMLIISIMFTYHVIFYGVNYFLIHYVVIAVCAFLTVTLLWFLAKRAPLIIILILAVLLSYFAWIIGVNLVGVLFFGPWYLRYLFFVPFEPFPVFVILSLMLVNISSSYGGWQNRVKKIEYTRVNQIIDNFENKVLRYIREHDMKIRISECATELKVTENEVKMAIQSLENKDLLRINKY